MSKDCSRLVLIKGRTRDDVYVGELSENGASLGSPKRLTFSDSLDFADAWARDGKTILFESDRAGRFQIFKQQLGSETAQILAPGPDDEHGATLSPDGAWILYWTTANGESPAASKRLMRLAASGGPPEQILETSIESSVDCARSSGSFCILSRPEQDYLVFYELDPPRGFGKEIARTPRPMGSSEWSISPDATRLAVAVSNGLHVVNLRDKTEHDIPFPGRVLSLSWASDGKGLFAAVQSLDYRILRIELDGKRRTLLNTGRNQWLGAINPSPDGRNLAFSQQTFYSNSWLLENF